VDLLNSCIFQIGVFTKAQAAAAKVIAEVDKEYTWAKEWDWDRLSRGCEGQIQWSRSLIGVQAFNAKFDAVLTAAKKKLAPGYTSYSGVFLTCMVRELANDDAEPRFISQGEIFTQLDIFPV
jgi:hypothetical protein